MTQLEFARAGQITPAMREVAEDEGLEPETIWASEPPDIPV